jgi:DNA (cytosine-5)-methyltransferase 1
MSQTFAPTVASLFAGAGGLDLGFKWAGYNFVWSNEIDEDAAKTHHQFVDNHMVVGDIRHHLHEVPKVDIIIGGPPCQSFSLVGKRLADDPRSQLVFAFQEAVERVKPGAFVMENVPGLTASKIGDTKLVTHLAQTFISMGYTVEIMKLIATDFSVPQKRQRVFLIGWKARNLLTRFRPSTVEVNRRVSGSASNSNSHITVSQALDDLPSPVQKGSEAPDYEKSPHSLYAQFMRQNAGVTVSLQEIPTMSKLDREFVRHIPPGGNYTDIPDEVSTQRIMNFKRLGGRTTTYGRLHPDEPAYTINTYFNRPNVGANYHHREERLITVREALRLQSFPDWFTPVFSSQRSLHSQVGNAVPPLMALGIATGLSSLIGWKATLQEVAA